MRYCASEDAEPRFYTIEDEASKRYFYRVLDSEVPDRVADLVFGDEDPAAMDTDAILDMADLFVAWNEGEGYEGILRKYNIRVWDPVRE